MSNLANYRFYRYNHFSQAINRPKLQRVTILNEPDKNMWRTHYFGFITHQVELHGLNFPTLLQTVCEKLSLILNKNTLSLSALRPSYMFI